MKPSDFKTIYRTKPLYRVLISDANDKRKRIIYEPYLIFKEVFSLPKSQKFYITGFLNGNDEHEEFIGTHVTGRIFQKEGTNEYFELFTLSRAEIEFPAIIDAKYIGASNNEVLKLLKTSDFEEVNSNFNYSSSEVLFKYDLEKFITFSKEFANLVKDQKANDNIYNSSFNQNVKNFTLYYTSNTVLDHQDTFKINETIYTEEFSSPLIATHVDKIRDVIISDDRKNILLVQNYFDFKCLKFKKNWFKLI